MTPKRHKCCTCSVWLPPPRSGDCDDCGALKQRLTILHQERRRDPPVKATLSRLRRIVYHRRKADRGLPLFDGSG